MRKNPTLPFTGAVITHHPANHRIAGQRLTSHADAQIASYPVGSRRPADVTDSLAKRSFDVLTAILGILMLLPALLAIAAAIKLTSRGPILFRQRRYGLNNRIFVIYKFRTMYVDKGDESGVKQTCTADERVTPIGTFLRRYSLDELPQLLNILRGDMSFVGPRPHVPGMHAGGIPYEFLVPNYFERHRVRPGLTGLAQAQGLRGSTVDAKLARARIEQDLKYIQNWSFELDLRIIIETARTEFLNWGNGI